jgi:Transposase DDE domain group 1
VAYPMGEARLGALRVDFDRRIKLEFHGAKITSDGGLLAYREHDDALGFTEIAITKLLDVRRGRNVRHELAGLFRQAVFGQLAGYEDVNDAVERVVSPLLGRKGLSRALMERMMAAVEPASGGIPVKMNAARSGPRRLSSRSGAVQARSRCFGKCRPSNLTPERKRR